MDYPKLPDGPSPQGSAGSRALGEAEFQTKYGSDFKAVNKAEGFQRVTLNVKDTYLTNGLWNFPTPTAGVPRAADSAFLDMHNTVVSVNYYNPIEDVFLSLVNIDGRFVWHGIEAGTATGDVRNYWQYIVFGYKDDVARRVTFSNVRDNGIYTVIPFYFQFAGTPAYIGPVTVAGSVVKKVGACNMRNGGTDSYGNVLLEPWVDYAYSDGTHNSVQLPMPTTGTHYYTNTPSAPIVTKTAVYVIIFETYYYDPSSIGGSGSALTPPTSPPPVWLLRSIDNGTTWGSPTNVVSAFNRLSTYPTMGGLTPDSDMYMTYASSLTFMSAVAVHAVIGDDSFLYAVAYENVLPSLATGNRYPDVIKVTGGTATAITFTTDTSQHGGITALAYMGAGKVMAIYTHYDVSTVLIDFWYSTDSGTTWTRRTSPTGFDCTLSRKFMGSDYLICDVAATDATDGVALITAWDQTEGSYFVYATKDLGATWTRRGRITAAIPPGDHDTVYGTGGGQYDQLQILRGPTSPRKLDPALPARYQLRP